jgi:hypothetical protein
VKSLRIAAIVEGHGEFHAVRGLLERIWRELLGGEYLEVLQPIRCKRQKLVKPMELSRAIALAAAKLAHATGQAMHNLVLVLVDADTDKPCQLGPDLLQKAGDSRPDIDITCVVANVEYETWFVAAADSLSDYLEFSNDDRERLAEAEPLRWGKGWIEKRFRGPKYSETQDQPAMTARMDLTVCRQRSASFDKLCRELEKRRSND